VIGVGVDIVAVERIADLLRRHGDRFVGRCFRTDEAAHCDGRGPGRAAAYAGRWAAKEAFLKALGRPTAGIPARDIELVRRSSGQPLLRLHGPAAAALAAAGGSRAHVSLSHERDHAVAVVVIE
jgi:holo-[acyl-carrier protein] synthase